MTKTYLYVYRPYLVTAFARQIRPAFLELEKKHPGIKELDAYLSVDGTLKPDTFYIVCDSRHPSFESSMSLISESSIVKEVFFISTTDVAIEVSANAQQYENFLLGKYSRMYPTDISEMKCFADTMALRGKGRQALAAMRHDVSYYYDVIDPLTDSFSEETKDEIFAGEYDSPPVISEEIFNPQPSFQHAQ